MSEASQLTSCIYQSNTTTEMQWFTYRIENTTNNVMMQANFGDKFLGTTDATTKNLKWVVFLQFNSKNYHEHNFIASFDLHHCGHQ